MSCGLLVKNLGIEAWLTHNPARLANYLGIKQRLFRSLYTFCIQPFPQHLVFSTSVNLLLSPSSTAPINIITI